MHPIARVAPDHFATPLRFGAGAGVAYVAGGDAVVADLCPRTLPIPAFERAGPRERIAFRPDEVTAAILTAGGLCPGLNDVVRAIVHGLHFHYGVPANRILGVRHGFAGFALPLCREIAPIPLADIRHIQGTGGSVLGVGRNHFDIAPAMEWLRALGVNLLFAIGGDGTLRGAAAIDAAARAAGMPLAVVGLPKTIDNDIPLIDRSFGFETAVGIARDTVVCAHTEAEAAFAGVGVVRVMGRDAGFVAAAAALAAGHVHAVLIPEIPFALDGENGLLAFLHRRLQERRHALVVVAEGAGEHLFAPAPVRTDATGNRLHQDIGRLLCDAIRADRERRGWPVNVRYIDPGYLIRGSGANAADQSLCVNLGHHAVHAAMSGRTGMAVGLVHGTLAHLPLDLINAEPKRVDPAGALWRSVLEATGQPSFA